MYSNLLEVPKSIMVFEIINKDKDQSIAGLEIGLEFKEEQFC